MNASRNAVVPLICIALAAMASMAGAVELAQTGTNAVTGTAFAHGDSFVTEALGTTADSLYSGVWAHAYVPTGTEGINSAESQRTVPARTETRTQILGSNKYNLMNTYGDTTVIAKASKTGVLGAAEAFSESSALAIANDNVDANLGSVNGDAQLVAYAAHSGTGTADASATGSAAYNAMMSAGQIDVSGSASGSVALNVENNYGGTVKGTAWKGSYSYASSMLASYEGTFSQSFEYLYLDSGRNALSAKSDIVGTVAGDTTASGFYALPITGKFGNAASSATGDLSGTATTYKLGDAITPDSIYMFPIPLTTQYSSMAGTEKALAGDIGDQSVATQKASAILISQGIVNTHPGSPEEQSSSADTESMTSAGVTRTLTDANEAFGASYIDNGALSVSANTASVAGGSPITLASISLDTIFMGSGAHLVSRLTGGSPASAADLKIHAENTATNTPDSTGSVTIWRTANPATSDSMVKAIGPAYSPSGTSADATGSYLTAMNIAGTSLHALDTSGVFVSPSSTASANIDEINVWSWIDGSDPRTHTESAYGLSPYVSIPVYTASPAMIATGVTTGPTATSSATATSRAVDTIFRSEIAY